MVTISYQGERDKGVVGGSFAITNWTEDFEMNCNAAADAELADVLATLIAELIRQGIIKGSVATA
jgi:hypothetical protein